jgi:myxalamid-type polyketide synthase MxaC
LGQLISNNEPQRIVGLFDWTVLRPLLEARHTRPLLTDLGTPASRQPVMRRAAPEPSEDLADLLARTPADERGVVLQAFVRKEIAAVLRLAADDPVPPEMGFFDLGMDSLTAVELRRRLERGTGLSLPSSLVFSYPNLHVMSDFLARELGDPVASRDIQEAVWLPTAEETILDDLTDIELEARLRARLQEVR